MFSIFISLIQIFQLTRLYGLMVTATQIVCRSNPETSIEFPVFGIPYQASSNQYRELMAFYGLTVGCFIQSIQISSPDPFSFLQSGFQILFRISFKRSTTPFGTEIIARTLITDDESCIFGGYIHPTYRISYQAFIDPHGWFQTSHFHPPFVFS